jgi:hypothetical protein
VRIIDQQAPLAPDSTSWTVDSVPIASIGVESGPAPHQFGRIAGVARLSDGRVVVADAQAHEIRFFDALGKHLHSVGREGGGPGEFMNFSHLMLTGVDSILVLDYEGARAHRLDPNGEYVRTFFPRVGAERAPISPVVLGTFSDGSVLLQIDLHNCSGRGRTEGFCEDSAEFVRTLEGGTVLRSFGVLPVERQHRLYTTSGRAVETARYFGRGYGGIFADRFYYADAERRELRRYDGDGRLERIVRIAFPVEALPASANKAPKPAEGASAQTRRLREEEQDAGARFDPPRHRPPFDGMLMDRAGNMWLRRVGTGPETWWVADTSGLVRYSVRMPRMWLLPAAAFNNRGDIGDDYIVAGRVGRETEVETANVFRIRK